MTPARKLGEIMSAGETMRAVRIFSPTSSEKPFDEFQFVNFDEEQERAIAIAREAERLTATRTILVFGYGGNGKRGFAQVMAARLFEELKFHVVWVDVPALASHRGDELADDIESVRRFLKKPNMRPVAVMMSGLDVVDEAREENPDLASLESVVSNIVHQEIAPPVLLLATATSPKAVSSMLSGKIELFYFAWPGPEKAGDVLNKVGIRNGQRVAVQMYRLADEAGIKYTTGSLVNGAIEATHTAISLRRKLNTFPAKKAAEFTRNFCSITPIEDVESYERETRKYIDKATSVFR